jgi:hypothetical protein
MADPTKMTVSEMMKYQSRDEVRIASSMKNLRQAVPYLLGLGVGMVVVKAVVDSRVKSSIFGENNNGGDFLNMYTKNSESDMAYNREFQRMRYLTEDPVRNDPLVNTSGQLLADLGHTEVPLGLDKRGVTKKAPHYKYY